MKRRSLLALATAGVVSAAAVPATAAAAVDTHVTVSDHEAVALFITTDPSGCVLTEVTVTAIDVVTKQGGAPSATPTASVNIFKLDNCTSTTLILASGSTPLAPGEVKSRPSLSGASLNTNVTVSDAISGTSFPVNVAVTWTGVGKPFFDSINRVVFKDAADRFVITTIQGTVARNADASGTVTDGTTNLTPEPAVFGILDSLPFSQKVTFQP